MGNSSAGIRRGALTPGRRSRGILAGLAVVLSVAAAAAPAWSIDAAALPGERVLARVAVAEDVEALGLPVYAHLADSTGQEYVLTIVERAVLEKGVRAYSILDTVHGGNGYYLARERRPGARALASAGFPANVLHDDGRRLVVRGAPGIDESLSALGFDLKRLPGRPVVLARRADRAHGGALAVNPVVGEIIGQVLPGNLNAYLSALSGAVPVTVGGAAYTIATRHTRSGTPIQKATQYAYERFQALGLITSYQAWTGGSASGRNVIGELRGSSSPDEIVLLTAHLDDMPTGGTAPGADDNASGSAALLVAAEIMSRYQFGRTVRFVLFTGEEQGLYGSAEYAYSAAGENIIGVLNLDMIAFNTLHTAPTLIIHTRPATNPGHVGDRAIADAFAGVIGEYGLAASLTPRIIADGESGSDHSSFWDEGIAAVLAIEDDYDDFNPYYHSVSDTPNRLDNEYFTAYVKAAVGTVAQLSGASSIPVALAAVDDTASVFVNGTVVIDVLENDTHAAGDALAITGVTQGAHGVAGIAGLAVAYSPAAGWSGRDSFTYTVGDGHGGADTATVTVHVVTHIPEGDIDNDGSVDPAVYYPANGTWYVKGADGANLTRNWGWNATIPVPADYDDDGLNDLAVYYPANGTWYVKGSAGTNLARNWGWNATIPVPADWDGDRKLDIAVYYPTKGTWHVKGSAGTNLTKTWGWAATTPVPGDYDGDGHLDLAVYYQANGNWYVKGSAGTNLTKTWGWAAAMPVPADWDGDGTTDLAVYYPANGTWYIKGSAGANRTVNWGWNAAWPVPADWDDDGAVDCAVYYVANGTWYIKGSAGTNRTQNWGWNGADPVFLQYQIDKQAGFIR
jgi:hypothetical protein